MVDKKSLAVRDGGFKSVSFMTDRGIEKLSDCLAEGKNLVLTHVAVGDGNGTIPTPSHSDIGLVHEVWRGPALITGDQRNASIVHATSVIPVDVGGFSIREVGVFDSDGELIAVCNMPGWPKISADNGVQNDMTVGMLFAVSNDGVIEMTYDPNVIGATMFDIIEHNNSITSHAVLFGTKVDKEPGKALISITEIERLKTMASSEDMTNSLEELNTKIGKKADNLKFENDSLQLLSGETSIGKAVNIRTGGHEVKATPPADTKLLWVDAATHLLKYHDGSSWQSVAGIYS